jgi:MinD superfamily P-loop ATPase
MNEIVLPIIDYEKCTACNLCESYCPTGAVSLSAGKPFFSAPQACSYCGVCEDICPSGAIELSYQIQPLPKDIDGENPINE